MARTLLIKDENSTHIIKAIKERVIKDFLDVIVMSEVKNEPLSGYDLITRVNNKFHFLVSAGTVYTLLYSLERKGLVKGNITSRKTTYTLIKNKFFMI